jgi:LTXXQ motif family protein
MRRLLRSVGTATIIGQLVVAPGFAKEFLEPGFAKDQNHASPTVLLPGAITGIGSHGPVGYWRLCEPLSIGLNGWRLGFIEQLLKPSDAQKELLQNLLPASLEAKNAIESACSKETVATGPAHLTAMERRVTGLLNALKAIREPYDAFYQSLDKHQRQHLDALGPSRRGWRW